MKTVKKIAIVLTLIAIISINAYAKGPSQSGRGERSGPPPEAYSACDGKNEGDSAEFVSPHGDTVTGTCEEMNGDLVLRPDTPPNRR